MSFLVGYGLPELISVLMCLSCWVLWTERNVLQTASSSEDVCYEVVVRPDPAFGGNTLLFVPQWSILSVVLEVL